MNVHKINNEKALRCERHTAVGDCYSQNAGERWKMRVLEYQEMAVGMDCISTANVLVHCG